MKFIVSRTGQSSRDTSAPCEGAVREQITRRYLHSGELGERITEEWVTEIDDLVALMAFCDAHGECIIDSGSTYSDNLPSIEIYDDYRE